MTIIRHGLTDIKGWKKINWNDEMTSHNDAYICVCENHYRGLVRRFFTQSHSWKLNSDKTARLSYYSRPHRLYYCTLSNTLSWFVWWLFHINGLMCNWWYGEFLLWGNDYLTFVKGISSLSTFKRENSNCMFPETWVFRTDSFAVSS